MHARGLGHGYGTRNTEGGPPRLRQGPPFRYRMVEQRSGDLRRVFRESRSLVSCVCWVRRVWHL